MLKLCRSPTTRSADEEHFTVCGTPHYIAPEVTAKQGHTFAVDLWSIGCLLFALLTGSSPFHKQPTRSPERRLATAGTDSDVDKTDGSHSRSRHTSQQPPSAAGWAGGSDHGNSQPSPLTRSVGGLGHESTPFRLQLRPDFERKLSTMPTDAAHLVRWCLEASPADRPSANQALECAFLRPPPPIPSKAPQPTKPAAPSTHQAAPSAHQAAPSAHEGAPSTHQGAPSTHQATTEPQPSTDAPAQPTTSASGQLSETTDAPEVRLPKPVLASGAMHVVKQFSPCIPNLPAPTSTSVAVENESTSCSANHPQPKALDRTACTSDAAPRPPSRTYPNARASKPAATAVAGSDSAAADGGEFYDDALHAPSMLSDLGLGSTTLESRTPRGGDRESSSWLDQESSIVIPRIMQPSPRPTTTRPTATLDACTLGARPMVTAAVSRTTAAACGQIPVAGTASIVNTASTTTTTTAHAGPEYSGSQSAAATSVVLSTTSDLSTPAARNGEPAHPTGPSGHKSPGQATEQVKSASRLIPARSRLPSSDIMVSCQYRSIVTESTTTVMRSTGTGGSQDLPSPNQPGSSRELPPKTVSETTNSAAAAPTIGFKAEAEYTTPPAERWRQRRQRLRASTRQDQRQGSASNSFSFSPEALRHASAAYSLSRTHDSSLDRSADSIVSAVPSSHLRHASSVHRSLMLQHPTDVSQPSLHITADNAHQTEHLRTPHLRDQRRNSHVSSLDSSTGSAVRLHQKTPHGQDAPVRSSRPLDSGAAAHRVMSAYTSTKAGHPSVIRSTPSPAKTTERRRHRLAKSASQEANRAEPVLPKLDLSRLKPYEHKSGSIRLLLQDRLLRVSYVQGRDTISLHIPSLSDRIDVTVTKTFPDLGPSSPYTSSRQVSREELPSNMRPLYMYAHKVTQVLRSQTPKVALLTPDSKCILMENYPKPDFHVYLAQGWRVVYQLATQQMVVAIDMPFDSRDDRVGQLNSKDTRGQPMDPGRGLAATSEGRVCVRRVWRLHAPTLTGTTQFQIRRCKRKASGSDKRVRWATAWQSPSTPLSTAVPGVVVGVVAMVHRRLHKCLQLVRRVERDASICVDASFEQKHHTWAHASDTDTRLQARFPAAFRQRKLVTVDLDLQWTETPPMDAAARRAYAGDSGRIGPCEESWCVSNQPINGKALSTIDKTENSTVSESKSNEEPASGSHSQLRGTDPSRHATASRPAGQGTAPIGSVRVQVLTTEALMDFWRRNDVQCGTSLQLGDEADLRQDAAVLASVAGGHGTGVLVMSSPGRVGLTAQGRVWLHNPAAFGAAAGRLQRLTGSDAAQLAIRAMLVQVRSVLAASQAAPDQPQDSVPCLARQ